MSVLSKTETAEIVDKMRRSWPGGTVPKVKNFKSYEIEDDASLLLSDELIVAKVGDKLLPFLGQLERLSEFPSIVVDMGAIKFVCNGARIMRPGIVEMSDFAKEDIVTIKDQQHGKVLAIGIALENSDSAKGMTKGYVADNLHYISDKIWEAAKEIQARRS